MPNVLTNLSKGIYYRVKKVFYRPYSIFDIGWAKEKILKHQTEDTRLKHHLYKNKYRIAFKDGPTFLISINELFINEFYKFRANKDCPKIIDCGSYIGTSILYFKINYPNAVVTGFEPDEENFSILKSNVDSWDFSDTNVINAAIWINNESISFNSVGNMSSKIETDIDQNDKKKNCQNRQIKRPVKRRD